MIYIVIENDGDPLVFTHKGQARARVENCEGDEDGVAACYQIDEAKFAEGEKAMLIVACVDGELQEGE